MASLFVVRGNDQGYRFELEADPITVGRDVGNSIQLHDTEVSRRHAVIRRDGRHLVLADNKSSNGTFVNGRRVQTHTLAGGDQLQLGGTLLLYTGDAPSVDLAEKIDIVSRGKSDDRSRIVRAIPQAEGRGLLGPPDASAAGNAFLAKARSNLEVMYRTTLAVSRTLDIDQLLQAVMQLIFEWVECDRGCVMLIDQETKKLEPRVRRNRKSAYDDQRLIISKTILDQVMERNEGVLISDASADAKWNTAASIVQAGIREAICAPMQGRHSLVGVIYLDVSTSPQQVLQGGGNPKFNEEHLRLLIAIAHQAALAVEETRHYAAMVQAERLAAVGQAIACLSHHVKNILQGIRGGAYLLKEGISTHNQEMVAKGWEFVEKNQDRISHLVMDMLTFSKEREPEMHPSDINAVAGDVCELMQSRAADFGVTLVFEPMVPIPKLTFDPEGLHRAILNVVSNAIDAADPRNRRDEPEEEEEFQDDAASIFSESTAAETVESVPAVGGPLDPSIGSGPGSKGPGSQGPDSKGLGSKGSGLKSSGSGTGGSKAGGSKAGGSGTKSPPRVDVRTAYDPVRALVQVVVEDNGGGIPPDALEHIFSLFVSNKGSRGTGLGLPVSQKILKEHGGKIDVESTWGKGARFTLEMPAVPVDATRDLEAFKDAGESAGAGSGLAKAAGGSGTGSGVVKEPAQPKEAGGSGTNAN